MTPANDYYFCLTGQVFQNYVKVGCISTTISSTLTAIIQTNLDSLVTLRISSFTCYGRESGTQHNVLPVNQQCQRSTGGNSKQWLHWCSH